MPFNMSHPFETRVDSVLNWLQEPDDTRPDFVSLYFEEPDGAGEPTLFEFQLYSKTYYIEFL